MQKLPTHVPSISSDNDPGVQDQAIYRFLVESLTEYAVFAVSPEGFVISWNSGAQTIFGYTQDEMIGRSFDVIFTAHDVEIGAPKAELESALSSRKAHGDRWHVRKNGSLFWGTNTVQPLYDRAGALLGFVKLVHDTTEQHIAAENMRRRAQYDALTELPNRQTFCEYVQQAISLLKREPSCQFAVFFVDLDHFKAINDEFGHTIADEVLALISRRLEKCVRSGDIVSRVGGDEFAILLNGIKGALEADDAAQRVLAEMRQAVNTEVGDVFAGVSIGIAIGTADYDSPEEIVRDADAAMYVAKTQGRARAVAFDPSIGKARQDSVDLTTALRHAIDRNEMRIVYQPVFRLRDQGVVGLEALVRWKHPRRGLLLPGEFIPQAEDSNLIAAIDRWALAQACDQLANWQSRGIAGSDLQMSVNVSSREFSRDDFLSELQGIIKNSALAATNLRLEITEGTVLERAPRAYEMLAAVRALGVSIDVDDFGTGYASLGALNHIFVDGLKVDWSFVTSTHAHHGWEIVESVISLAHKLGLVATAEGIETAEQLSRLIALDCDFGQGYLLAPALGPVAAATFLRGQVK
jgi:diguanylate cyclase (GGDEF)-like protein/PAS domain S-box-containing protein